MISIIIPVYNCADKIEKCVRSIQEQTYSDLELILVDDGSTDDSGQLCDQFGSADARIRVIHKENGGVSSARNAGIDAAQGEFILFCDSDDYTEPAWCSKLVSAAQSSTNAFPICNYFRNTSSKETINYKQQCDALDAKIASKDFFKLYQLELIGTPWNKIYRRNILSEKHIRFRPDLSLGEDLVFNLDYMKFLVDGFTYINEPLYHYSLGNEQSLSAKYYPDLQGIYHAIFSELKAALNAIPGAFSRWEQDYYRSFFFAFDRVFRNTFSAKNPLTRKEKWQYNDAAFHSEAFQLCKKAIPKHYINILQYWGLQTNSSYIHWITVIFSETISKTLHRKKCNSA